MSKGLMKLSPQIWTLLNNQYNREIATSVLFLDYASKLDEFGMTHFSELMYIWSREEVEHSLKMFDYLKSRDSWAKSNSLMLPKPLESNEPRTILESITEYQRTVSDSYYEIAEQALLEKDFATYNFLKFFIEDQIQEEKKCTDINDAFRLSKDYLRVDKRIEEICKEYHGEDHGNHGHE